MVVLGEAVPQHQPRPVGGGAVEDALGGGQLGRGEREAGGQGVGVEGASLAEGVDPDGQGGGPALQGAPGGRLGVEEHRVAHRPHPGAFGAEGLLAAGVDGEVEPDPEQLLLAPGQPGGQLPGVLGGDLDVGIAQASFGGIGPATGFEPGQLAAEAVGGDVGRDRLDVQGDVEAAGVGGERLEPAVADLAGVADDGEAGAPAVPDAHGPGADLDGVGTERRRRPGGGPGDAGEQAGHRRPFAAWWVTDGWARVTGSSVS